MSETSLGALKPKAKVTKVDLCFPCENVRCWKHNYKVNLEEQISKRRESETPTSVLHVIGMNISIASTSWH